MSADNVDNAATANVIGAPVLAVRGPFPPDRMKEFLVGVGEAAQDELLAQVPDQEQTLTVGATIKVDQEGNISGSNLFLSSHNVWEAGYKVSNFKQKQWNYNLCSRLITCGKTRMSSPRCHSTFPRTPSSSRGAEG